MAFYDRRDLSKALKRIKEEIRGSTLSDEEWRALEYFVKNLSVGEIIAVIDLRRIVKVNEPERVLRRLVERGILERGEGCYNLSARLRRIITREAD